MELWTSLSQRNDQFLQCLQGAVTVVVVEEWRLWEEVRLQSLSLHISDITRNADQSRTWMNLKVCSEQEAKWGTQPHTKNVS
ncbi:hypothetical protein V6N13_045861 [Hibiscus sabdariffa]